MSYEKLVGGLQSEQVEKIELIRGLYNGNRSDIDVALSALKDNKHVPFFKVLDYLTDLRHKSSPEELYHTIKWMKESCDRDEAEAVDEAVRNLRAKTLGLEAALRSFSALTIESRSGNEKNYSNGARYAGKTLRGRPCRKSLVGP